MPRFYQPDLGSEPDSPFARDANDKLVRRGYWLDMNDRPLVLVMTRGIGAHLTNDEKREQLTDLKREHLIDQLHIATSMHDCMTMDRLIQNPAFNQDDIERLAMACEEALRALHISNRDDPINEIIARVSSKERAQACAIPKLCARCRSKTS